VASKQYPGMSTYTKEQLDECFRFCSVPHELPKRLPAGQIIWVSGEVLSRPLELAGGYGVDSWYRMPATDTEEEMLVSAWALDWANAPR
jgi:hypothetical protein